MRGHPFHRAVRVGGRAAPATLLALAALAGRGLAAQQPDTSLLTVASAIAMARTHHPAIVAAGARRQQVVGVARQVAAPPNPVIEWRQENLGSPLAPDGFVTVSQPLDLTGRRLALRAETRAVDARAVADSATVALEVETAAARAFWRAALARGLLDVAALQRADAEYLAATEAVRAREGAVAELSALRTALELERARLAEATNRAEWTKASAELARTVGVASGALPPVAPLRLSPPAGGAPPSVETALASALGTRQELVALRAGVSAARQRLAAERRGILPDVALQAGTKRTAGYTTRVVGVAVPLPLFDRSAGARGAAAGAFRLAAAELAAAELAVRAEVTAAVEGLRALLDPGVPRADSLAAHADEVARIAAAAYAAGGGSLLELLEARRAHAESAAAALRWAAELHLARLTLNRALGAPLLDLPEAP